MGLGPGRRSRVQIEIGKTHTRSHNGAVTRMGGPGPPICFVTEYNSKKHPKAGQWKVAVLEEHLQGRIRSPRAADRILSIWNGMLEDFARHCLSVENEMV